MTSHRREVRPRYGRIAALCVSLTVSVVAALAGIGLISGGTAQAGAGLRPPASTTTGGSGRTPQVSTGDGGTGQVSPSAQQSTDGSSGGPGGDPRGAGAPSEEVSSSGTDSAASLPPDSGSGRRIVFSQSLQRVWLVGGAADTVRRTYLVSGSVTHNLQPGTYSVYSRSRWAVGIDDSGVMQYFVRFTQGPTGAAIGFHSIPTKNGVPLQTKAQLGTPESHGCIRQDLPDAIALWDFAPVGTKVVVVA